MTPLFLLYLLDLIKFCAFLCVLECSSAKQTQRTGLHSNTKPRRVEQNYALFIVLSLHRKLRRADVRGAETRALARVVCYNEYR